MREKHKLINLKKICSRYYFKHFLRAEPARWQPGVESGGRHGGGRAPLAACPASPDRAPSVLASVEVDARPWLRPASPGHAPRQRALLAGRGFLAATMHSSGRRAPQAPRLDAAATTLRNPSPMAGRRRCRSTSPVGGTHHARPHQEGGRDLRAVGEGRATTSGERGGRERRMRGWEVELSRDPHCAGERASGSRGEGGSRMPQGVCA